MARETDSGIADQPAGDGGAPAARMLGAGQGWRAAEYICCAGPGDRAFEERHEGFTIAAVVEGSFRYQTDTGTALLRPGALLLGNHGACYECGHAHSTGDRCIAFHFGPDYFAEVAASAAGSARFRFPAGALPARAAMIPWLARIEARLASDNKLQAEEAVTQLIERVIRSASGAPPAAIRVSARDERRVTGALRHIERHSADDLRLDALAAVAAMSKYHFLRTFRRAVGMTPYQYLLSVRMRSAAGRLLASAAPVSSIAYEAGFGDLSTFNGMFRAHFGESPTAYRAREQRWSGAVKAGRR